jgi:hypothetical protein
LTAALKGFLSRLQLQQTGTQTGSGSFGIREMEDDNEKVEEVEIAGNDEDVSPEKYTRKLRDSSDHVRQKVKNFTFLGKDLRNLHNSIY